MASKETLDASTNTEPGYFSVSLEETDVEEVCSHDGDQNSENDQDVSPWSYGHFGHRHHGHRRHNHGNHHHGHHPYHLGPQRHHAPKKFKHHRFGKFKCNGFGKIKRHGLKHHGFQKIKHHGCKKFQMDECRKYHGKSKHCGHHDTRFENCH